MKDRQSRGVIMAKVVVKTAKGVLQVQGHQAPHDLGRHTSSPPWAPITHAMQLGIRK